MDFVTNEKLTIVGAAGMIGSNMAQTALMMRLTPNICLYDPYGPALEGVSYKIVQGTAGERQKLTESYEHLCKLRDEVIAMGILPPVGEWGRLNPHLK